MSSDTPGGMEALSLEFPLSFRILSLFALGSLAFAANVHILSSIGIDACIILDIRNTSGAHLHPSILYRPLYRISRFIALTTLIGFAFWRTCLSSLDSQRIVSSVPTVYLLFSLPLVLYFFPQQRKQLLSTLQRIVLDFFTAPCFSDVIVADILTSFARVFGDLSTVFFTLVWGSCPHWIPPFFNALPFLFRLRQCLAEVFSYSGDENSRGFIESDSHNETIFDHKDEHYPPVHHQPISDSENHPIRQAVMPADPRKRSMLNALKYATALPVILFGALLSSDLFHNEQLPKPRSEWIFQCWIVSVIVNSMYSFWWDVTNDWGFFLLIIPMSPNTNKLASSPPSQNSHELHTIPTKHANEGTRHRALSFHHKEAQDDSDHHHHHQQTPKAPTAVISIQRSFWKRLLRERMLLTSAGWIYFVIIVVNLLLRLTWSLKLSARLHGLTTDKHSGGITLEAAEIARRWIWVFVRLEWEIVRLQEKTKEARVEHA